MASLKGNAALENNGRSYRDDNKSENISLSDLIYSHHPEHKVFIVRFHAKVHKLLISLMHLKRTCIQIQWVCLLV